MMATRQCLACWQYPLKKLLDGNDMVAGRLFLSKQVRLCSSMNMPVRPEWSRAVTQEASWVLQCMCCLACVMLVESCHVFAEVRCSVVCCTCLAMCRSSVAPLLSFHSRCACSSTSALSLRRSAVSFPILDLRGFCPSGFLRAMLVFGKVAVLLRWCRKGSSPGLPLCDLGLI